MEKGHSQWIVHLKTDTLTVQKQKFNIYNAYVFKQNRWTMFNMLSKQK